MLFFFHTSISICYKELSQNSIFKDIRTVVFIKTKCFKKFQLSFKHKIFRITYLEKCTVLKYLNLRYATISVTNSRKFLLNCGSNYG